MKYMYIFICILSLILCSAAPSMDAEKPYRVAVVYSGDITSVADHSELTDKLDLIRASHVNTKIQSYYLNYSQSMSEARLHENASKVFQKIKKFGPDLTVVFDDIAFEHVSATYLYPAQYNNIFFHVWKDNYDAYYKQYHLQTYSKDLCGVLVGGDKEKITSVLDVLEIQNVYIVKNDQRSYPMISSTMVEYLKPRHVEVFDVDNLYDLSKTISTLQSKPKGAIVLLISNLTNTDTEEVATPKQIAKTVTSRNKKHFEMSYLTNYSKYGIASSDVLVEKKINKYRMSVCDDLLIKKFSKSKLHTIIHKSNDIIVNVNRVTELHFDSILTHPELMDGIDNDD